MVGVRYFSVFENIETASGAQPGVICMVTLVINWPEREADHSPPSGAEVKNGWSCRSSFHGPHNNTFVCNLYRCTVHLDINALHFPTYALEKVKDQDI
jgi:hypothetical protein